MTSPATSVAVLDIGTLTQDMVSRGYTESSWYLIDVEAGFELWQGGAGLKTNSFSVSVNGSTRPPPPPTSPPPTSPPPTGSGACTGTLAPGATGTVGFTATGSTASPTVTCS